MDTPLFCEVGKRRHQENLQRTEQVYHWILGRLEGRPSCHQQNSRSFHFNFLFSLFVFLCSLLISLVLRFSKSIKNLKILSLISRWKKKQQQPWNQMNLSFSKSKKSWIITKSKVNRFLMLLKESLGFSFFIIQIFKGFRVSNKYI